MKMQVLWGGLAAGMALGLLVYCSPAPTTSVDEDAGAGDAGGVCEDAGGKPSAFCTCDLAKNKDPVVCYTGPLGTSGRGACVTGKRTCLPDGNGGGTWSTCVGEVVPQTEVCDYLDNDCNGVVDDVPGSSALSADAGGAVAVDQCQSPSCDPSHSDAGVDCYTGTTRNACKAGRKVCAAGRQLGCQSFGDIIPTPELCNGWDDDCNDQVDDNTTDVGPCQIDPDAGVKFPDGGVVKGECLNSTSTCADGGLVCPPSDPGVEKCDGKDQDCNGKIDDKSCTSGTYTLCCHSGSYYTCGNSNYPSYGYTCVPGN